MSKGVVFLKYYTVAEFLVTDPSWIAEYTPVVTKMVESHGGRYLARTANVDRLEGEDRGYKTSLIVEWPSKEAATKFYTSKEYKPYLADRLAGTDSTMRVVAGIDDTGISTQ